MFQQQRSKLTTASTFNNITLFQCEKVNTLIGLPLKVLNLWESQQPHNHERQQQQQRRRRQRNYLRLPS